MLSRKTLSMLSLCQRAGMMTTGEESVEIAMKKGGSMLVIVAGDASENTKEKFVNKANFYKIPVVVTSTRDELSSAIGKDNRTVFTVTDTNFAEKIMSEIEK